MCALRSRLGGQSSEARRPPDAHGPRSGSAPASALFSVQARMSAKKNFCRFTRLQDDYLIQLVSAQPLIYDPSHQYYKDLSVKDNVWKEISLSIMKTVEECKVRWRSIRDLYNRKKKEVLKNPGSARAIKWEYMDQLSFLDRAGHIKQSISKFEGESQEGDSYQEDAKEEAERDFEEDICLEECPDMLSGEGDEFRHNPIEPEIKIVKPKRRRINGQLRSSPSYDYYEPPYIDRDPISLFFASMAQTVMTFPPTLAAEAKERVCRIITSLEYRAHVKNDRYAPSEASSKEGHSPTRLDDS
ncbi:uncharacterized protein LOC106673763 [Cimex lectularius]|uniref:MADF domain-containing protein n=1 Tax=Cimex lectularius TaxID=79782 RepID=A0A8I6SPM6_CIMLE|nr:uncharacterized protein LOC106673763 [Cimex lectularius]